MVRETHVWLVSPKSNVAESTGTDGGKPRVGDRRSYQVGFYLPWHVKPKHFRILEKRHNRDLGKHGYWRQGNTSYFAFGASGFISESQIPRVMKEWLKEARTGNITLAEMVIGAKRYIIILTSDSRLEEEKFYFRGVDWFKDEKFNGANEKWILQEAYIVQIIARALNEPKPSLRDLLDALKIPYYFNRRNRNYIITELMMRCLEYKHFLVGALSPENNTFISKRSTLGIIIDVCSTPNFF